MAEVRFGVQLQPQHCTIEELRAAWQRADAMGAHSIWVWDHFSPLYGPPDGAHFECWSLLAAMAVDTRTARFGAMVSCNTYRNPDLLADIARTVDRLSGGRLYLGIGAGWFERDYDEYGYPFTTGPERQDALVASLERIKHRLGRLNPPPAGPLPIMIGASGEKRGLRIVAQYADAWNTYGSPELVAHKSAVLDRHCTEIGRDPAEIERSVLFEPEDDDLWRAYRDAGITHLIFSIGPPYDLLPLERALAAVAA